MQINSIGAVLAVVVLVAAVVLGLIGQLAWPLALLLGLLAIARLT